MTRDESEIINLAHKYLPLGRCIGGHRIITGYCCPWCKSDNPSTICFKEEIRKSSEKPSDYPNPKAVSQFRPED
jgi:hypothetical protein